jgi:hypothetical protein
MPSPGRRARRIRTLNSVLLDSEVENDVAYKLCQLIGRAILPVRRVEVSGEGEDFGTAFFFDELAGPTVGGDPVREYLLTADVLTHAAVGEIGLRASVTEPAGVASDAILMPDFARRWVHHPDAGVAIMPTGGLYEHGRAEGWQWRIQPVSDGIAARADSIAEVGPGPSSAFVLALGVGEDGSRPLEVAIERVVRDGDAVRVTAALPPGYVGAPVFTVYTNDDGDVALRCLGLVLPGDGSHPLATFDRIRAAIAETIATDG